MLSLTLVATDPAAVGEAAARLGLEPDWLGPAAADASLEGELAEVRARALLAIADLPVDVCVQPAEGRRKRLFVADMDSTIIGCECLDELADFAGLKAEIAAITERAMRGEIEFEGALRERVGKLRGLGLEALQRAYDERVQLNPGAETWSAPWPLTERAACWSVAASPSSPAGWRRPPASTPIEPTP
jgi:phosphoserine phosphatase